MFGGLTAALVVLDLGTKRWAEAQLETPLELVGGMQLAVSHNSGIAFGRLADAPEVVVLSVVGIALAVLALALTRAWLPASPLAAGLLVGGAIANALDRISDGRVTDFIDPPSWPAFNLADIAITLGVALLLLDALATTPARSSRTTP